jgi:hypothetical protein
MNVTQKGLWMLSRVVKGIGGILKRAWNALRRHRTARNSEAFLESVRESGGRVHPESANPVRKPEENVAAATGAASCRMRWILRFWGWVRTALRWQQPARDGGAYSGAVRSSGAERRQVMLKVSEVLTQEIRRHHDPSVQSQMGASQCNLLLRSHRRGLFGSITISENLHMSYEFQGMRPVPLGLYDEVGHLFADENRRHPASRWQVVPHTGVISFTGELQLRGDPGEDRRLMRRYVLRRMEVVHRRLSGLFVQWESRSRARQEACTEKVRAAG